MSFVSSHVAELHAMYLDVVDVLQNFQGEKEMISIVSIFPNDKKLERGGTYKAVMVPFLLA